MAVALITGITGQDGGYLTERLLEDGYDVHGLVHEGDSTVGTLLSRCPRITVHNGDLLDVDGLRALVADVQPDEIYSLGGISSVAYSWQEPELTFRVCALAVAALLEAAWQLQEHIGRSVRFLQASSAEIFGQAATSPQNESTPISPVSPYGAAKAFAHLATGVYRARGLSAMSLVLYNHESPRRPETFVTRKITATVARIVRGEASSLALGSLTPRRDWGWAPDYVDAMVRAIRASEPSDYVIATGQCRSVRDFVDAAFRAAGVDDWAAYVQEDPQYARPVESFEQCGDAARARRDLGWTPTVGFDELVARMVEHDLAKP